MKKASQILALSLTAMLLVFAGASAAIATHTPGHSETPSCDDHPNNGGPQNKHCEPAPAPPAPAPSPVTPAGQPSPAPDDPADISGGGGGGGGNGGGGGGVAPVPDAVTTDTLPFTGFDVPQAMVLFSLLLGLGGISLALGKRRASTIK